MENLKWNQEIGSWEADIEWSPGNRIRFAMTDEGDWATTDPKKLLTIGSEFLAWARTFEPQCRIRIADDLLDVYNQSWADEDPNEGPPPRTRSEFLALLRLTAICLDEAGSSSWVYECGDLFAGHGVSLMLDVDRSFLGKATLVG